MLQKKCVYAEFLENFAWMKIVVAFCAHWRAQKICIAELRACRINFDVFLGSRDEIAIPRGIRRSKGSRETSISYVKSES